MKLTLLIRKLVAEKNKVIAADTLKNYCKELKIDYLSTIKYLLRNRYVIRILKGIFYLNSFEERKLKKIDITLYGVLKAALELKGVKHWYFGLETALKLNNVTHEYFTVDYIVSDSLFRSKPITIMDHKIKFIKIKSSLFGFGISKTTLPYSDPEKTILDMIYLDKNRGLNNLIIKNKVKEYLHLCSKKKIKKYLLFYPTTVSVVIKEVLQPYDSKRFH
ncbi:hypothetical protein HYY69_00755 [Candidatus Woesearchaeota archaeon]|nr:hypothetical protein [Candidatus Woesearchaeota archaeon]